MDSQESNNRRTRSRIRIAEVAAIVVCLVFVCFGVGKYVVLPLTSSAYAARRHSIIYEEMKDSLTEGDILDRNGAVIMSNSWADEPENYSYSYLLGYYQVNDTVEVKYGLRGNLSSYLYFLLDENKKGATVRLTTDNGLQDFAFEQILNGQEGSVTVIDNDTGAILCLASQSTVDYNVNDTVSFVQSGVESAQLRRGTFENDPPGSTFKVITMTSALEKVKREDLGEDFFSYNDTGSYVPAGSDFEITNYAYKVYGPLDLEQALDHSVNTYFADLGVRVGADALVKTASAFYVGKEIKIPFLTTLHSNFDIGDGNAALLAQTAFGQGNTEITPVHLCLIAEAIANNGTMMKPYIVSSITSGSFPCYRHMIHKLADCTESAVAEKVKYYMHSAAEMYGITEDAYGYVCAKTGTAECADGRIHTYIIGFTKDYSFCISLNNSDTSETLWGSAKQLVNYLIQLR